MHAFKSISQISFRVFCLEKSLILKKKRCYFNFPFTMENVQDKMGQYEFKRFAFNIRNSIFEKKNTR